MNQPIPNDVTVVVDAAPTASESKESSGHLESHPEGTVKAENARDKSPKRGVRSPHGLRRPRSAPRSGEDKAELPVNVGVDQSNQANTLNPGAPQQRRDRNPRNGNGARPQQQGQRSSQ